MYLQRISKILHIYIFFFFIRHCSTAPPNGAPTSKLEHLGSPYSHVQQQQMEFTRVEQQDFDMDPFRQGLTPPQMPGDHMHPYGKEHVVLFTKTSDCCRYYVPCICFCHTVVRHEEMDDITILTVIYSLSSPTHNLKCTQRSSKFKAVVFFRFHCPLRRRGRHRLLVIGRQLVTPHPHGLPVLHAGLLLHLLKDNPDHIRSLFIHMDCAQTGRGQTGAQMGTLRHSCSSSRNEVTLKSCDFFTVRPLYYA